MEFGTKFKFTKLKLGLPQDLSINYLDAQTAKYVLENKEEI